MRCYFQLSVTGGRIELVSLGAVVGDRELFVCGSDASKGTRRILVMTWSKVILQTPLGNRILDGCVMARAKGREKVDDHGMVG